MVDDLTNEHGDVLEGKPLLSLRLATKRHVERVLTACEFRFQATAEALDVPLESLAPLMAELGITLPADVSGSEFRSEDRGGHDAPSP